MVCIALADRIDGASAPADVDAAMTALRTEFLGNAFRPVALSAGSRGLIRVVSNLGWLVNHIDSQTAALLGSIKDDSVAVLRASARVLINGDRAGAARLSGVVAEHRVTAFRQYANDIVDIIICHTISINPK